MSAMDEDYDLRRMAEWDWVIADRGVVLHHVKASAVNAYEWRFEDVQTSCGRTLDFAYVPGLFTRTGAKRCDRCCDHVGYPRGKGSPKNDPACAELLKKRVRAVKR